MQSPLDACGRTNMCLLFGGVQPISLRTLVGMLFYIKDMNVDLSACLLLLSSAKVPYILAYKLNTTFLGQKLSKITNYFRCQTKFVLI
jgi:hypothetical protein